MATLTSLITRVRSVLIDPNSLIWTDDVITEGFQQALAQYNQALSGEPVLLEGLDGAASSNLPAEHESLLVWGAAGHAALARAVNRAESFQPGGEFLPLHTWGNARLAEYRAMLSLAETTARMADLRQAASAPWGSWE